LTSLAFGAGYASSDELTAERSSEAGQSSPSAAEAAAAAPEESPRAFSKGELCSAAALVAEAQVRLPPHARCPDSKTMEAQAAERAKTVVAQVPSRAEDRFVVTARLAKPHAASTARSGRKFVFVAAEPAAKRFAARVPPPIIAPEKQAKRARPSRKPSPTNIKAAKALPLKNGRAIVTKRVRMAAVR